MLLFTSVGFCTLKYSAGDNYSHHRGFVFLHLEELQQLVHQHRWPDDGLEDTQDAFPQSRCLLDKVDSSANKP